jgi:hypothetical protein
MQADAGRLRHTSCRCRRDHMPSGRAREREKTFNEETGEVTANQAPSIEKVGSKWGLSANSHGVKLPLQAWRCRENHVPSRACRPGVSTVEKAPSDIERETSPLRKRAS